MADNTDVEKVASLFQKVVTSLGQTPAAVSGGEKRIFFPDGINLISFTVSVGTVKVELKVSSDPKSTVTLETSALETSALEAPSFSAALSDDLVLNQKVPNARELDVVGAIVKKITRSDPEFAQLVSNTNADIVFKNEEVTGADRMMTPKLQPRLDALAGLVKAEWPGVRLRVTEAWDENNEHAGASVHYEGRAVDLTTAPIDPAKLGRLGRLAVNAGFDWVFYENASHVHASVVK